MTKYTCPVCRYHGLRDFPYHSYEICPCCGTEFGYDDVGQTHKELREAWVGGGKVWWSKHRPPPDGWDAEGQLLPAYQTPTTFDT